MFTFYDYKKSLLFLWSLYQVILFTLNNLNNYSEKKQTTNTNERVALLHGVPDLLIDKNVYNVNYMFTLI